MNAQECLSPKEEVRRRISPDVYDQRKAERVFGMALYVNSHRSRTVPTKEIVQRVIGYEGNPQDDDVDKRLDRDKKSLRTIGLDLSYIPRQGEDGTTLEGYTVKVSPPPHPKDCPRGRHGNIAVFTRFAWILYRCRHAPVPFRDIRKEFWCTNEELMNDVYAVSLCRAGELPHEFIDAYVEDGMIHVGGPNPYSVLP